MNKKLLLIPIFILMYLATGCRAPLQIVDAELYVSPVYERVKE